ncbi:hypothetical protein KSD_04720 [Ktedonobacter sp. SOSP1-85]|nr:hypothetical protein KSD_04720 [Ktedonobacter sp. SOSP1-85]
MPLKQNTLNLLGILPVLTPTHTLLLLGKIPYASAVGNRHLTEQVLPIEQSCSQDSEFIFFMEFLI